MNQRFRFCTLRAAAILVVALKALVSAIAAPSPQVVPIYPNTNEFTYVGRHLDLKSWHITDGGVFYPDVPSDIGTTIHPAQALYANTLIYMDGPTWSSGTGSPEGFRIAPPGSIYSGKDGGSGTSFYIKESGTGDTGWVPISPVGGLITTNYTIVGGLNITVTTVTDGTDVSFTIDGIQGDSLWRTNASGIYFPLISTTATVVIGQSADDWWSPSFTDGLLSVHNTAAGDSEFNTLVVGAIDNVVMENSAYLEVLLHSGVLPQANLQFRSFTNWQNPSAPIQEFSVDLQAALGQVLVKLNNNGIIEFAVSNQVTSVMGLQLTPLDNALLSLGPNNVNVASNSFVRLAATLADPTTSEVDLSAGVRDGMLLLLQNVGTNTGFTLYNGSPLYDDPAHFVTLQNGDWVTDDYGDGLLLIGGVTGWAEVARFTQNTNTVTGDLLWELVGNVMRTVPANPNRFAFRYGGVPQLTIGTNGGIAVGPQTLSFWGTLGSADALISAARPDLDPTEPISKEIWLSAHASASIYGFVDLKPTTNAALFSIGTDSSNDYSSRSFDAASGAYLDTTFWNGTNVIHFEPTIANGLGSPYTLDSVNAITSDPLLVLRRVTTNQLSFGPDARITFGPGITNGLYRVGSDLVVSNSTTGLSGLELTQGNGHTALFHVGNSGQLLIANEPGGSTTISDGANNGMQVLSSQINPILDAGLSLGGSTKRWLDLEMSGTAYVEGFRVTTNYARLAISHGGTNGAIVYNSQSAGTAGNPRPHRFDLGATNQLNIGAGWVQLANGITKAQKTAITATNGMIVYQTDNTPGLRAYVNGAWVILNTSADP